MGGPREAQGPPTFTKPCQVNNVDSASATILGVLKVSSTSTTEYNLVAKYLRCELRHDEVSVQTLSPSSFVEPVNTSEWVSPLLVAQKHTG